MYKEINYIGKALAFALMLLLCPLGHASTYYFSSSLGDDNRSSTQAQSENTPWRSIQKLNSIFSSLQPGDKILFKSGETFQGTILLTKSGTEGNPISFAAYGPGENPVLTGMRVIKDWVSKGGNIYEAQIPEITTSLSIVVMDNVLHAMGRYPNSDSENSGYLTIDSFSGGTIGSSGLQAPANMSGGEIVIRKNNWIMDRHFINWQSGSNVNYDPAESSYIPAVGYGFFIQNHASTLDQHGEWFFDKATKKLLVFYQGDPAGANIRISTVEQVISTQNSTSHIIFSDLTIQGSNENLINVDKSSNFTVENCQLEYVGKNAINTVLSRNLRVSNSKIENSLNGGISLGWDDRGAVVTNNTISKIHTKAGMGQSADSQGNGIFMSETSSDILVENNSLLECGSNGIYFNGNNITVKNNLIDTFCFVKDDGGGIYTFTGPASTTFTNRKITNNIIVNGIGAVPGTKPYSETDFPYVEGIYLDLFANGIEIDGNTIGNVKSKGIFVNNSRNVSITNNKIFNTGYSIFITSDYTDNLTRNITVKNNDFLNKSADQLHIYVRSKVNTLGQLGAFDNNVYSRPVNDSNTISLQTPGKTGLIDLQTWNDSYGLDELSTKSPVTYDPNMEIEEFILFEYNFSNSTKSLPLSGSYVDLKGKVLTESVTIPAYSSVLLLKTEASPVVENIAPTVNITAPATNTEYILGESLTITATAADSGGTIAKLEFFRDSTLLGTDTITPYSFDWTNLPEGSFALTAKATDNQGTSTISPGINITVAGTAIRSPYQGTASTIPGKIEAENYDLGGQGISYSDVDLGNNGGAHRTEDVDISSAAEGGSAVGWMNLTEWLEYTVNISTAGSYNLEARVASPVAGGTFHIEINGVDVTGPLTVPATGGWNTWASVTKSGVNLPAGTHVLRYVLDSYGDNETFGNFNSMTFTNPSSETDSSEVFKITVLSKTEETPGKNLTTSESTNAIAGETIIFIAEEEEEVVFDYWSVDGNKVGDQTLFELLMPEDDITLTKHFRTFVKPEIKIVLPGHKSEVEALSEVEIEIETKNNDAIIDKIELFNGQKLIGELTKDSTGLAWKSIPEGNHELIARITDINGKSYFSDPVMLHAIKNSKDIPNVLLEYVIGPNPTTDQLNVIFKNLDGEYDFEFRIVSMNGIVQKTFITRPEESTVTIDVSDLQTGTYILHMLANGKNHSSKKFIKKE